MSTPQAKERKRGNINKDEVVGEEAIARDKKRKKPGRVEGIADREVCFN